VLQVPIVLLLVLLRARTVLQENTLQLSAPILLPFVWTAVQENTVRPAALHAVLVLQARHLPQRLQRQLIHA